MVSKQWKMMKSQNIISSQKTKIPFAKPQWLHQKGKKSVELKTSKSIVQVKRAIQTLTAHMMHVKCLVNLYIWLRVHLNHYIYI